MVPWTPTKSDDDPAPTSVSQCTTSRRRYFPAQGFTLLALLVGMSTASLVWHAGAVVSAQGSPVFKARTEIVRLDVSITDGSGRPVADVNPEEIEVVENGQPRPVVLFRHVREAASEELQHGPAFEEVSANGGMTAGRLYVLVFDQAHITARNEQRVRQAAEKFLLHTVKPGDGVAIYALPGPGPMLAFTSDFIKARLRLLDVKGLGGRPAPGPREYDAYRLERGDARIAGDPTQAGTADVVSEETQRAMASQVVASADTETHLFLRSLAQALGSFRSIEGRKSVIVFSEGFVSDNVTPELEQVASAAALSQSLVYGVDLNRPGVDDQRSVAETTEKRDALRRLASETNGMLFANAGDLDASLSSVAAQANDYYLVGFEPARAAVPNEYHRIDVRVSRRGLVAHARSGYSTLAAVSPATDRQAIDAALTVPRTSSALPIEYTTYERGGSTADKPRIIASVTAHVPRVGSADRQVDVVFVVRDAANGRVAASGSDRTRVQPVAGDAPGALDLVPYSVQFDVPPGEYWMRVLVREPGGTIGTADRRFHVWPLSGPGIATSDLIVTKLDGQRFDAPTHANVAKTDQVLAYMEMYGCDGGQPVEAKVDVVSAESNEVVATVDPVVKPGTHGERIVRARLPVELLKEGYYAARVRVSAANQTARTVIRNFRLVAPVGKPTTKP